jgi:hypothetical protein
VNDFMLRVIVGLLCAAILTGAVFLGMAAERGRMWREACGAACRTYSSGIHDADPLWCVCKNGIALKYHESGLYSGSNPTKR